MKNTIIGVDLAKEVIQVCMYTNKSVHSNKEVTQNNFLLWLFNTPNQPLLYLKPVELPGD